MAAVDIDTPFMGVGREGNLDYLEVGVHTPHQLRVVRVESTLPARAVAGEQPVLLS
jgi:hypothetical protein